SSVWVIGSMIAARMVDANAAVLLGAGMTSLSYEASTLVPRMLGGTRLHLKAKQIYKMRRAEQTLREKIPGLKSAYFISSRALDREFLAYQHERQSSVASVESTERLEENDQVAVEFGLPRPLGDLAAMRLRFKFRIEDTDVNGVWETSLADIIKGK